MEDDFEEKLLKLVSAHEVLYKPKYFTHDKIKKQALAWKVIGKKLGKKPEDCKNKWFTLRNCYRKVLRKIEEVGGLPNYHRRWRHLDNMKFMKKYEPLGHLLDDKEKPSLDNTIDTDINSPKFMYRFLELVKNSKILYDPSAPGYKDIDERNYAWHLIGKELNVHRNDLKRKWKTTRSFYLKLLRKISAQGGLKNYNRKWVYFFETAFLAPFIPNLSEELRNSIMLAEKTQAVQAESTNNNISMSSEDCNYYDDDEEEGEDDEDFTAEEEEDEYEDSVENVNIDKYAPLISSTVDDIEHSSDNNSVNDDENNTPYDDNDNDEDEAEFDDFLATPVRLRKTNVKDIEVKSEIKPDASGVGGGPCCTYFSLLGSKIDESAVPLSARYKMEKCVTDLVYGFLEKYSKDK